MKRDLPAAHYLNRELGLLEFNRRVLAQAADESVPLLERLGFLTIVSSSLDEFFEIRVAGPKEQWSAAQKQWIRAQFFRELLPVLTPIGLDPAHAFPKVLNKSLNLAVELVGRDAFGCSSAQEELLFTLATPS
jgi:polyphosphate kinase